MPFYLPMATGLILRKPHRRWRMHLRRRAVTRALVGAPSRRRARSHPGDAKTLPRQSHHAANILASRSARCATSSTNTPTRPADHARRRRRLSAGGGDGIIASRTGAHSSCRSAERTVSNAGPATAPALQRTATRRATAALRPGHETITNSSVHPFAKNVDRVAGLQIVAVKPHRRRARVPIASAPTQ